MQLCIITCGGIRREEERRFQKNKKNVLLMISRTLFGGGPPELHCHRQTLTVLLCTFFELFSLNKIKECLSCIEQILFVS